METTFSTLTEAIAHIYRSENTSLLSLDRICQALRDSNLKLETGSGTVPCSQVSRRRISSILSSSELFIRAGPPRSCMWALRPCSPFYLSDGALSSCINHILTEEGPLTISQIVELGDVHGADATVISEFLIRSKEYETDEHGVWWFAGQPKPEKWTCDSVVSGLVRAFEALGREASIEDLSRLLCLSTLPHGKKISRRKISRELSRRPDLFSRMSRAKYALATRAMPVHVPVKEDPVPQTFDLFAAPKFEFAPNWDGHSHVLPACETPPEYDLFDPVEFFSIGFSSFGAFE